jgi:hypothetical protein
MPVTLPNTRATACEISRWAARTSFAETSYVPDHKGRGGEAFNNCAVIRRPSPSALTVPARTVRTRSASLILAMSCSPLKLNADVRATTRTSGTRAKERIRPSVIPSARSSPSRPLSKLENGITATVAAAGRSAFGRPAKRKNAYANPVNPTTMTATAASFQLKMLGWGLWSGGRGSPTSEDSAACNSRGRNTGSTTCVVLSTSEAVFDFARLVRKTGS